MSILNKIKNILRLGYVTNTTSDSEQFPKSQITTFGDAKDLVVIYPYGFSANAPINTMAIIANVGAGEKEIAFPFSSETRQKNLKSGEVAIGNYVKESIITFLENGDIKVDSENDLNIEVAANTTINSGGSVTVTAPDTTLTTVLTNEGDATINGNLTVAGNIINTDGTITTTSVTASGSIVGSSVSAGGTDFSTHVHSGVATGTSNTGPPV